MGGCAGVRSLVGRWLGSVCVWGRLINNYEKCTHIILNHAIAKAGLAMLLKTTSRTC